MRVLEVHAFSVDSMRLVERPRPVPDRGKILLRMRAASLNFRDLAVLSGNYIPTLSLPYVPLSDGCGVVEAIGEGVTRFAVGQRVIPVYTQGWHSGLPPADFRATRTLGGALPGVLQEYMCIPADDAVAAPDHLSDIEAATLPIAAVTAWSALAEGNIKAGSTVLVMGTGGVALFSLQFARIFGARVIALTSTAEKAALMKRLGADAVINYKSTPDWEIAVRAATHGDGVDIVVETVGSTLDKSLASVAFGGFVAVIGSVGGQDSKVNVRQILGPLVRIQGIAVGSRARFESMLRAVSLHKLHPVIDSTYPISETGDAFRKLQRAGHIGKITIAL